MNALKVGYKYKIESVKTSLLVGEGLDTAEDIDGWNINLVMYEMWSDGDLVQCNIVTVTATTEENNIEYLKSVVKTSVIFSLVFQLGISQAKAYSMFI